MADPDSQPPQPRCSCRNLKWTYLQQLRKIAVGMKQMMVGAPARPLPASRIEMLMAELRAANVLARCH